MRPFSTVHAVAATLLAVGLVLQVFLAGLGVFDDPSFFMTHRDMGYTLEAVALVCLVVAALARAGRSQVGLTALVLGLFFVQSILVGVRDTAPMVAALHPVNGFLILFLSIGLARQAWRTARTPLPDAVASGAMG